MVSSFSYCPSLFVRYCIISTQRRIDIFAFVSARCVDRTPDQSHAVGSDFRCDRFRHFSALQAYFSFSALYIYIARFRAHIYAASRS